MIKLVAFAVALLVSVSVPSWAQPATPCLANTASWTVTSTTVTLWVCTSDGLSWAQLARAWGSITGTLANQTDLQTALNAKQATLVSATNIKTINGATVLGSGDLVVGGGVAWGGVTGTLSNQTDLQTALNGKQASGSYATGTGTANGTNTGDQTTVSGNAGTATTLQNARTINGTSFNGSANITLGNGSVTLAQMADMATASLVYRKTAGTGVPEVNTLATLKTDLALVKADVGLGNVDNTSDANKPVSTAEQTALNLKANLASPTFTGTVVVPASTAFTTPVIGAATGTSLAVTGALTSSGTAGVGYATGAGGAVTQLTSKATATPAINKPCGTITMNAAALAAAAIVSFVVTNNIIGANDVVIVQHDSAGTFGAYYAFANTNVAATSFKITVKNISAGSLSEAIVLRFCIVKGAVS